MNKIKALLILSLVTIFLSNSYATVATVFRVIVNETQLTRLVRLVIPSDAGLQTTAVGQIRTAIRSLIGPNGTEADLRQILNSASITDSEGMALRQRLLVVLEKDSARLTRQDLEVLADGLAAVALRSGRRSTIIACNTCLRDAPALGQFFAREISNPRINSALQSLPRESSALTRHLRDQMSELGLGSATGRRLDYDDQLTLGIYLNLLRNGNEVERRLANTIKELSAHNGRVELLSGDFQQNFWKIFSEDITQEQMAEFDAILTLYKSNLENVPRARRKAKFYEMLDNMSQGNPELRRAAQDLRSRNCFFE